MDPSKMAQAWNDRLGQTEARRERKRVTNALTVDVEDWIQSTYDRRMPVGKRVVRNTTRLLNLLDEIGVKATFFVQGMVAERFPRLVREIAARGHEIGCHGYGHTPVFLQSPEEFVADVERAQQILTQITGVTPHGYRAPDFSVVPSSLWVLEVLVDKGFAYDSSVFPVRVPRYGINGWEITPHVVSLKDRPPLVEFPLSVVRVGPLRVPFLGGGYTRLLPLSFQVWGIRRLNAAGTPAMLYLHPYELNPHEMGELPIPRFSPLRVQQNAGRFGVERKLRSLCRSFHFAPAGHVLRELGFPV